MGRFFRTSLLLAALSLGGPALSADPVYPPGSRIGLVPPADMTPSRGLAGFQSRITGAAILAIEMPAQAFPTIATGFTDEALKAQGFALKERETPRIGESEAILVSGDQADGGRAIGKTILLAPDPTMTALVIGQYPADAPEGVRQSVLAALRTVTIRPPLAMAEQMAALPFQINDLAGFRPVRVMAGNSVLLTDGPKDQVQEAEQPILIVAQSFAPAPPADQRDAFARAALGANTFLKETMLERSQGFRQGGVDWHEIVAKAKDGMSDQPVLVMQTIRFEPGGYTRMVGIVRVDQREAVLPRFRRIVDTIGVK
jgi:hypothetical protein